MTESNLNAAIRTAAAALAEAELNARDATATLATATTARDVIAGHITALEAERAAILAARRTGHHDDAVHGPRLILLAADLDDLKVILAAANAEVAPVRQAAEDAHRRVSTAEYALATIRDDEVLRLTRERADELGILLIQAIASIDSHRSRLATTRNLWTPTKELAGRLHALDLQRQ